MKLIEMNIDKIVDLCRKYKVAKLWVFGSILTPRFNDESDVDFSVIFHYDKTFCEDLCFRSAVQWEIAIIGEAMNRILKVCPDIPITSSRRIVNTRNSIHFYVNGSI